MRNGRLSARRHGFTYLSLIILVAIIGLVSAAAIKLGSVLQRGAAERELLAIGAEYADALESYAKATPPGQSPLPPSFKELLRDPRFPGVRRHLRRIYVDPMTGSPEWGIVYANNAQGQQGSAAGTSAVPGAPSTALSATPFAAQSAAQADMQSGMQSGPRPGMPAATPSPLSAALNPQGGAGEPDAAKYTGAPQPLKAGGTAGILAIYSLSGAKPVKIGNFPMRFQGFDNRTRISDWKFARSGAPAGVAPQPVQQPRPGQPLQPGQPPQPQPGTAHGQPPQEPPTEPVQPAAPLPDVPPEPPPEPEAPPQRGGDEPAPADEQQAPSTPANPAKTDS